jgi:hypothetical protein
MKINGAYKFSTEAIINKLDFAFLYSKLQENDREFVFTGGTTSWRKILSPGNTGVECCLEIPEPTGVYATEEDALNDERRPGTNTSDTPQSKLVTLFYDLQGGNSPVSFYQIFKIAGQSTYPNKETQSYNPNFYGFWQNWQEYPDSNFLLGVAPTQSPQHCPLLKPIPYPSGLIKIGFRTPKIPNWKKENYMFQTPTALILSEETAYINYYATAPNVMRYVNWEDEEDFGFYTMSRMLTVLDLDMCRVVSCSQVLNNWAWYPLIDSDINTVNISAHQSFIPEAAGEASDEAHKNGYFAVMCQLDKKGAIESYLNQILAYWGIPGSLRFVRGVSPSGCNTDANGEIYPDPVEEEVPVYSLRFKGRYSSIILNYQSKGKTQELTLPIEFPTRATKVKFIPDAPAEHYKLSYWDTETGEINGEIGSGTGEYIQSNIPATEWRPTEQPIVSEAFVGRVSMDKENIYASILYGTIREWETGKQLPDETYDYNSGSVTQGWIQSPDTVPFIGDEYSKVSEIGTGVITSNARPKKDSWKYCKTFTIDKKTFSIVSESLKTYPEPLTETKQFVIGYEISTQEKTPRYRSFYDNRGTSNARFNLISISNLGASDNGFSGNPICYPQIAGTIPGTWATNPIPDFTTDLSLNRYFPIESIPDYIKPQSLWNQKDWIFWNLLERPKKPLTNTSYFIFELETKFSAHGRSSVRPYRYYIDLKPVAAPPGTYEGFDRTSENYFAEVVESERLRGSPILDSEGKVVKWARISPYSYPYFEPARYLVGEGSDT